MRETVDDVCKECGKKNNDYVAAPHHLAPGTILNNKYEVGAVLGEGDFGITYIGRDTKLDLRLAIKEYFPSGIVNRNNTASTEITAHYGNAQSHFEKGKKSFLEETRTLAKFSSDPNIVSVRDFFGSPKFSGVSQSFVGSDRGVWPLFKWWFSGVFPWGQCIKWSFA